MMTSITVKNLISDVFRVKTLEDLKEDQEKRDLKKIFKLENLAKQYTRAQAVNLKKWLSVLSMLFILGFGFEVVTVLKKYYHYNITALNWIAAAFVCVLVAQVLYACIVHQGLLSYVFATILFLFICILGLWFMSLSGYGAKTPASLGALEQRIVIFFSVFFAVSEKTILCMIRKLRELIVYYYEIESNQPDNELIQLQDKLKQYEIESEAFESQLEQAKKHFYCDYCGVDCGDSQYKKSKHHKECSHNLKNQTT